MTVVIKGISQFNEIYNESLHYHGFVVFPAPVTFPGLLFLQTPRNPMELQLGDKRFRRAPSPCGKRHGARE